MRIALINSMPMKSRSKRLYPLALLKIGAWRKSLGDECVIYDAKLPKAGDFDEIWITTVFTYDIPYALGLVIEAKKRANIVRVGGISATLLPERFEQEGAIVHKGLLPEAERFQPDYSLLGFEPEYSITHTSRGCIRKCKFCMVPKLEPEYVDNPEWSNGLYPKAKKILFYDNNWFAKDIKSLLRDTEMLHDIVRSNGVNEIDFNQGLDARLLTDEIADAMIGLPLTPLRFAFDGKQEDGHYQRAVRMMSERGFRVFRSYVLYNFMDTPEDFYYRLRVSAELKDELGNDILSFPMRYQPILEVDSKRSYVGKHWTRKMLSGFMTLVASNSNRGVIAAGVDDLEYWFGRTPDEFVKLINYPKIRELAEKRKINLRLLRAQSQIVGSGGRLIR